MIIEDIIKLEKEDYAINEIAEILYIGITTVENIFAKFIKAKSEDTEDIFWIDRKDIYNYLDSLLLSPNRRKRNFFYYKKNNALIREKKKRDVNFRWMKNEQTI